MAACFANSGDPDQMSQVAASDLSLHRLLKLSFCGNQSIKVQTCLERVRKKGRKKIYCIRKSENIEK